MSICALSWGTGAFPRETAATTGIHHVSKKGWGGGRLYAALVEGKHEGNACVESLLTLIGACFFSVVAPGSLEAVETAAKAPVSCTQWYDS